MTLTLVACKNPVPGEMPDSYGKNETDDGTSDTLNFYIITGSATSELAKKTVPQNINNHLKEAYNIELNIVFCSQEEYDSKVIAAASNTNPENVADIVLINSYNLFKELYEDDTLLNLTEYYYSDEFRTIQSIVDAKLLEASIVPEYNGVKMVNHYYTVPNTHRIGQYEYIVINKSIARDILHFGDSEIEAMTTLASLEVLQERMTQYCSANGNDYLSMYNDTVKIVKGNYELKKLLEHGVFTYSKEADEAIDPSQPATHYANISSYPTVDREEAFSAAFAIVKNPEHDTAKDKERADMLDHYMNCMTIIYALNTDAEFKNILQYGYVGTNYTVVRDAETNEATNHINLVRSETVTYEMNNLYTGNPYIAYYCEEYGWDENTRSYTRSQNEESVIASEIKTEYEFTAVDYLMTELVKSTSNSATFIILPTFTAAKYSDVSVSCELSANDYYTLSEGKIQKTAAHTEPVTISLIVRCEAGETSVENTYSFTLS